MTKDVINIIHLAQSPLRILHENLLDEVLPCSWDVYTETFWWEDHRTLDDLVADHMALLCVERRDAIKKFICQDAQRPPVNHPVISSILHKLRSKVLLCATECKGLLASLNNLCKSKIYQLQVAVLSKHHIFEFEVSMNNVLWVQMTYCKGNLRDVKLNHLFWKPLALEEVLVQVSSFDVRHHEVDSQLILKHKVHWA